MKTRHMIQISNGHQYEYPFPYLHFDETFDPLFFKELKDGFPSDDFFQGVTSVQGNRQDLGRWRKEFYQFIDSQSHWKELYKFSQSKEFCSFLLDPFKKNWDELVINDFENFTFSNSIIGYENRAQRLKNLILKNKLTVSLLDLLNSKEPLSVSFSIACSGSGYHSPAHIDARHKIVAFLIYFDDCNSEGKLNLFTNETDEPVELDHNNFSKSKLKLHKQITPNANTGVLIWNNWNSFHSVPPIKKNLIDKRRFLYISIASSKRLNCWKNLA